jgi:small-conductance mechanosensitive channel
MNYSDIVQISPWLLMPLIFFLWVGLFLMFKRILFVMIRRLAERTKTKLDDIFIRAADLPLTLFIFTSGGALVERIIPLAFNVGVTDYFGNALKAVTIIAAIIFVDRCINGLIKTYQGQIEILRTTSGFARIFVRIIIYGLGALVLLDSFGISVTPIIASLGIGSLAVALAIQPTLENLFSGIQIAVDKPFHLGDFIKLESGEEGFVDRIGWRSTWIRVPQNNVIVMPNKSLVNAKLMNYYYPDREMVITVSLGVHYNSDLDKVEEVLVDEGRKTLNTVTGGVKDFEPIARFHTFSDCSIDCTVALRVKEFADGGLVKHEFIKNVHKRFAREGIVIPYPIQAVNYSQEGLPAELLELESKDKIKTIKGVLK